MPCYQYKTPEGEVLDVIRPVDERDAPIDGRVLERVTVPERLAIVGAARSPAGGQGDVLAGYYAAEQKYGSRFASAFSKEQIKAVWADERN